MNKVLASWTAVVSAMAMTMPEPAVAATIKLQRPRAEAKKPTRAPAPPRSPRRRQPNSESVVVAPPAPPPPVGIDPALIRETVAEAKYTATLTQDAATKSAVIHVTDGKSGRSLNFNGCTDESHCREMEFYTLWSTPNEANVCSVWGSDITRDPTRMQGKPYCYTLSNLPRQLHLRLSSDQIPYRGMETLDRAAMKTRTVEMIGVWAAYLSRLQEAWKIARTKCPRASDRCA
jgi:hypothetical protein